MLLLGLLGQRQVPGPSNPSGRAGTPTLDISPPSLLSLRLSCSTHCAGASVFPLPLAPSSLMS